METPSNGGNQIMKYIPESDVYRLAFGSKLPTAEKFTDWVTEEVMPSIRKHGAYLTKETVAKAMTDPDFMIGLLNALKQEQAKSKQLEDKVAADKPKVIFADAVSESENTILIGDLAKLLKQNGVDTGQRRLFAWMRENGYLMKSGVSYNLPTQRSMDLKLFKIKETAVTHSDGHITVSKTVKVTGKGQQYFINLFLNEEGAA